MYNLAEINEQNMSENNISQNDCWFVHSRNDREIPNTPIPQIAKMSTRGNHSPLLSTIIIHFKIVYMTKTS